VQTEVVKAPGQLLLHRERGGPRPLGFLGMEALGAFKALGREGLVQ
jgi:hypothetical protein